MQYSLFTHGNALRIETPSNLASYIHFGWGTQIAFKEPVPQTVEGIIVYDDIGPGSWLHLPLTSTLNTFGYRNPRLDSVTILFDTSHCRITNVHVYDGTVRVYEFNELHLKGDFRQQRNSNDINPETPSPAPQSSPNTLQLPRPHNVFSAIGLSFFACAYFEDFKTNPQFDGPFPPATLTVSGAGAQFLVEKPIAESISSSVVNVNVNLERYQH